MGRLVCPLATLEEQSNHEARSPPPLLSLRSCPPSLLLSPSSPAPHRPTLPATFSLSFPHFHPRPISTHLPLLSLQLPPHSSPPSSLTPPLHPLYCAFYYPVTPLHHLLSLISPSSHTSLPRVSSPLTSLHLASSISPRLALRAPLSVHQPTLSLRPQTAITRRANRSARGLAHASMLRCEALPRWWGERCGEVEVSRSRGLLSHHPPYHSHAAGWGISVSLARSQAHKGCETLLARLSDACPDASRRVSLPTPSSKSCSCFYAQLTHGPFAVMAHSSHTNTSLLSHSMRDSVWLSNSTGLTRHTDVV